MTEIEDVVQMFLDAGDDVDAIQAILDSGPMSRATRFAALTRAGTIRNAELLRVLGSVETANAELEALGDQVTALKEEREQAEAATKGAVRKVEQLKAEAAAHAEPLALLTNLRERGMGAAELSRLVDMLGRIAADQGTLPEEGVAVFFEFVERFRNVLSLDLETRRAKAESATAKANADLLEAQLQVVEAASRVRREVIGAVQDLIKQGVKPHDLMNWSVVIGNAGLTPLRLGDALKEFADLEALLARRRTEVRDLEKQKSALNREVAALERGRDRAEIELKALQDGALPSMLAALTKMQQQLEATSTHVGNAVRLTGSNISALNLKIEELQRVERSLGRAQVNLEYGHAILTWDDEAKEFWASAPWPVIEGVLRGLGVWSDAAGHDSEIPVPDALGRLSAITSWAKLRPRDLILWIASGIDPLQEGVGRA